MNKAMTGYLQKKGYSLNDSMSTYIDLWKSWYKGNVKGFHSYRVWNGVKDVRVNRHSLQLAKSICEAMANLLFNEKCQIAINHKPTEDFIKDFLDTNNAYVKFNESQERKAAFGTMAYIPYWADDKIKMNYITAEYMIPLSWENGVIKELCVYSPVTEDGKDYTFTQLFVVEKNGNYSIENLLLEGDINAQNYKEVEINDIPGYESIEPKVLTNSPVKPFIIDRLNVANNIDIDNPLGLSIFANAEGSLRFVDVVYDSYMNEFVLGKKRIMVSAEAINARSGEPVFDPDDLVYYQLPESISKEGTPFIKDMNMDIRSESHEKALNSGLNRFTSQCGMGENYYRFNGGSISTATQVISENNTLFRTIKKHEIILEAVLVDLIRLVINIAIRHGIPNLVEDPEITITFDDSIIEDKDKEITRKMAEVSAGLIRPEVYLAWRYGITEAEAKLMMPSMPQQSAKEEGMQ